MEIGENGQNAARYGASEPRQIKSTDLLQDAREVLINHQGETYRLRLTKNGKLILHK